MKKRKHAGKAKRGSFGRSVMKTHKFNVPLFVPRGGFRL